MSGHAIPIVGTEIMERHAPHPLAGRRMQGEIVEIEPGEVVVRWTTGCEQRIPRDRIGKKATDLITIAKDGP